ncbi:VCBS repeat-containing protein [candidate division KSB1 bacterium]|nr:VCBS repeat-containing protein [candidate division KSB1 bacterium]
MNRNFFTLLLYLILTAPVILFSRTVTKNNHSSSFKTFDVVEICLTVIGPVVSNPFTQVNVTGAITDPQDNTTSVNGFCDAANGTLFKIRFTPSVIGQHSYQITYQDPDGTETFSGSFNVIYSGRHGFIIADPAYPTHFKFTTGEHLFICSQSATLIADMPENIYKGQIDKLPPRKTNCIRYGLEGYSHETDLEADVWPWGGTRDNPDYTRFDIEQWRKTEDIIAYAGSKEVYSELMIFCRKGPILEWADTQRYMDYILARLSAFTSIILWQTFNEVDYEYEYQKQMGEYLQANDPFNHLVAPSFTTTEDAAWPRDNWVDVAINHYCRGDNVLLTKIYTIARTITTYGKPGWCDETGREFRHNNNDGIARRKQYWTWNIGGAHWNYHSYEGNEGIKDLSYNGPGYEFLQYIRPFWESTEYWKLEPADNMILNDPASNYEFILASDQEIVVYLANQTTGVTTDIGIIRLNLPPGTFTAEFYDPSTGNWFPNFKKTDIQGSIVESITFPRFTDDLIIYLHTTSDEPNIHATPDFYDFGYITTGQTSTTNINLANKGFQELEVSAVELDGPDADEFTIIGLTPPFSIEGNESRILTVGFSPESSVPKQADILISSNDPDDPTFSIPISGNIMIDEEFESQNLYGFTEYIPKTGPNFNFTERPGYIRMNVPASDEYDHWYNADDAPQLQRKLKGGDWEVQTSVELTYFAGDKLHVGLMIYFSRFDLIYWGFSRGTSLLRVSRTGLEGLLNATYSGGKTVDLCIKKEGIRYTFKYKKRGATSWISVGSYENDLEPTDVGLIIKTWGNVPVIADFDYCRLITPTSENDAQAPQISNVKVINVTATTATITWQTDEPADSQIDFGQTKDYGNTTTYDAGMVTGHSQTCTNLLPKTTYHFRVVSKDVSGNLGLSGDNTFTTLQGESTPLFVDITNSSNTNGFSPDGYGHGVTFVDVNLDGLIDFFVTNATSNFVTQDLLYINQTKNRFLNEAQRRGTNDEGLSHAVVSADFDNDGDPDAFFSNEPQTLDGSIIGRNSLYRNLGNGYFSNITDWAGIINDNSHSRGTVALDIENDGDMDLYIANWGAKNVLYINDGTGRMTKADRGLAGPEEDINIFGQQGVASSDIDNDGDVDIYVARRKDGSLPAPNWLFINDGTGNFTEQAAARGVAVDGRSHGPTFIDIDNDADLDLIVMNFSASGSSSLPYLYVFFNNGNGYFTDRTIIQNIKVSGYTASLGDVDNDTDKDMLLVRNNVKQPGARPELYLNNGAGFFELASNSGVNIPGDDPRAAAYGDLENDGDIDFYIACRYGQNFLLENRIANSNYYIDILCFGPKGDYGGIGTKVYIYEPGCMDQAEHLLGYQESISNYAYMSQNQTALHFGLGKNNFCDIKAVFTDGSEKKFVRVPANQKNEIFASKTVPIELFAFTASQSADNILLKWSTASEYNNLGFSVQRSINHTDNWQQITFIQGNGTISGFRQYAHTDTITAEMHECSYRLKQIDTDGAFKYSPVVTVTVQTPKQFDLKQNYPNPFNPSTTIEFTLPDNSMGTVDLSVYDATGRKLRTLYHQPAQAGYHQLVWDGLDDNGIQVSSGLYFYRLTCGNEKKIRKLLKLK